MCVCKRHIRIHFQHLLGGNHSTSQTRNTMSDGRNLTRLWALSAQWIALGAARGCIADMPTMLMRQRRLGGALQMKRAHSPDDGTHKHSPDDGTSIFCICNILCILQTQTNAHSSDVPTTGQQRCMSIMHPTSSALASLLNQALLVRWDTNIFLSRHRSCRADPSLAWSSCPAIEQVT